MPTHLPNCPRPSDRTPTRVRESCYPVGMGQDTGSDTPDATIQDEIAKLRNAIMRTVVDLDRFCETVREATARIREMSMVGEVPHEARDVEAESPEPGPRDAHRGHEQGEDKWYDTHAD